MDHKRIIQALVESVVFLETADDDDLNPDLAVAQMEQIAAILQEMSEGDRQEFIACIQEMFAGEGPDSDRGSVIESLPESLGLIDE